MTDLPSGYLDIGGAAVHVAELRRHTSDVHRFMRCYPICKQLQAHDPGSEPWCAILDALSDHDGRDVAATLSEAGTLFAALGADLQRYGQQR